MELLNSLRKEKSEVDFDFSKVTDVDDATVRAFMNTTHTKSRQMPLLIARYVFNELENRLTQKGDMDAMKLAEIRGGMIALRSFGVYYTQGIKAWEERTKKGGDK